MHSRGSVARNPAGSPWRSRLSSYRWSVMWRWVRVLLQLGTVTVPFRALFSLTVIGIAMINSIPGGQALSTIYWYGQLRRYSVRRSVAAFVLLLSSLIGIATLVLLAACGLAVGSHGFASQARVSGARCRGRHRHRSRPRSPAVRACRTLGHSTSGRIRRSARAAGRRESPLVAACARLPQLAVRRCSPLRGPGSRESDDLCPWGGRCLLARPTRPPRSRFFRAAAARSRRP